MIYIFPLNFEVWMAWQQRIYKAIIVAEKLQDENEKPHKIADRNET